MTAPALLLSRCGSCTLRFLPRAGPCPRCGALGPIPLSVPPHGRVLAATELMSPAAGWVAPHRLALLELAESVRLLAVVEGPLPRLGETLEVTKDADVYRARPTERPADGPGRGEGESPRSGSVPSSFEPPR